MQQFKPWLIALGAIGVLGSAEARGAHGSAPKQRFVRTGKTVPAKSFRRIATFANYRNNADPSEETVSEIVSATSDGRTLVYTDSPLNQIGFVDIGDPTNPQGLGKLTLNGEPTAVSVMSNGLAVVGVNTSASFVLPAGYLAVIDVEEQRLVAEIPLGGQPDSVAVSPDGAYIAVAIENERDEDLFVDGVEGGLPQLPTGFLAIVDSVSSDPSTWDVRTVSLSGYAGYGSTDPEPEFVDINPNGQVVVSLQENNHVLVVDLETGAVESDFDAGVVTLEGVDAVEDDAISLTDTLVDVPREPDAISWIPGPFGKPLIATANEGDLFGGTRGFSIFNQQGQLVFDSGSTFERLAVRHGHYPETRSENKGTEPEAIEFGRFGRRDFLFVGSERGSFVAVHRLRHGHPKLTQVLPAPLGPEGLLAIPSRNLLVVAGEADDPEFGVRSSMMIYELSPGEPTYPQLLSADDPDGNPIAWGALSGLTAVPGSDDSLLAVWDSFYSESRILRIDASKSPAVITGSTVLQGGSGNYDPEGIAIAPDGSYWIASEGNASGSRPNRLLHVATDGTVLQEVFLPEVIEACRAASANRGSLGAGFEGVAVAATWRGAYRLLVAQQRGWDYTTPACEALDDDPNALNSGEPRQTRIWIYDPATGLWTHTPYALEPLPSQASWVGLSEITKVPNGFIVAERDNRTGDFAELKALVKLSARALRNGVSLDEKRIFDLLPAMQAANGWMSDKAEGVAVTRDGDLFVVTDNDGVEDWSGETQFLSLGQYPRLFPGD